MTNRVNRAVDVCAPRTLYFTLYARALCASYKILSYRNTACSTNNRLVLGPRALPAPAPLERFSVIHSRLRLRPRGRAPPAKCDARSGVGVTPSKPSVSSITRPAAFFQAHIAKSDGGTCAAGGSSGLHALAPSSSRLASPHRDTSCSRKLEPTYEDVTRGYEDATLRRRYVRYEDMRAEPRSRSRPFG